MKTRYSKVKLWPFHVFPKHLRVMCFKYFLCLGLTVTYRVLTQDCKYRNKEGVYMCPLEIVIAEVKATLFLHKQEGQLYKLDPTLNHRKNSVSFAQRIIFCSSSVGIKTKPKV